MRVCIIVESSRKEVDEIIHRNLLAGIGTASIPSQGSYWSNTVNYITLHYCNTV